MKYNFKLFISAVLPLVFLLSCGGDREYEYPSGYRVTLLLMGGKFSDGTSDRVQGGIMQPTTIKNIPRLIHGDPFLAYDQPFVVWNTDRYGYGDDYTADSIVDKHLTLYAIYGKYIYDEEQLKNIECNNPNVIYALSDNITISQGNPFEPLCPSVDRPFKGKLYGNGNTISFTTRTGSRMPKNGGLFAYTRCKHC
mgnify:CR=1 FL=1